MLKSWWPPRIALTHSQRPWRTSAHGRLPSPPHADEANPRLLPSRRRSIADNLGRAFPKLELLVLTNNRFATLKELEQLASLPTLLHLSLVDNPVRTAARCLLPRRRARARPRVAVVVLGLSPTPPEGRPKMRHGLTPRAAGGRPRGAAAGDAT